MSIRNIRSSVLAIAAAWGLVLASAGATANAVVDTSDPERLIRTASDAMLKDIDANRASYRKDRTQLYKLVDTVLLPNFDVNYAAQQVLGKHWRNADEEQRNRFVKAFYRSLLQTYGDALDRKSVV
jgi:phospholipid transport system substrate-binding protein